MGKRLSNEELKHMLQTAVKNGLSQSATYYWLRRNQYSVSVPRMARIYKELEAANELS